MCGEDGSIVGIAADYVRSKIGGIATYAETCVPEGAYVAAARGCNVIIGHLNTYGASRELGIALANYTFANPYAATKTSILYEIENPGPPSLFFLEPFAWDTWLLVVAAFMLAGLTITVLRGKRLPETPLRDASISMAGYARLFEVEGSTFWEDVVSAATAVLSVILVSVYSANMVARGYISTQTVPDFRTKPLVYAPGGTAKWYVDMRSGYSGYGLWLYDERGTLNSSILDAVERGEYFAVIDDISIPGMCDRLGSIASTTVPGVRYSFIPAVSTFNVSSEVFGAFVYDSVFASFYVGGERSCIQGDPDGVEGLTFMDTWVGFLFVGIVAASLVTWKFATYFVGVRRGCIPPDRDVIEEIGHRVDISPNPASLVKQDAPPGEYTESRTEHKWSPRSFSRPPPSAAEIFSSPPSETGSSSSAPPRMRGS
jgi:hypothetical protein